MIVHATLIARFLSGRWRGGLLRAPSGAGKSDLALRAIAAGWRLVADDRVGLWTSGGALYGRAPERLVGLVEVRGVGVEAEPALPFAAISLIVDDQGAPERLPEPRIESLAGVGLPRYALPFLESSAQVKLERAMAAVMRRSAPGPL